MVRAVRFHHHGGIDVLQVEDVELRKPAADEALVRVRAAGINPGEATIRTGALEARFPATASAAISTSHAASTERRRAKHQRPSRYSTELMAHATPQRIVLVPA